jgi:hypothetical protein
VNFTIHHCVLPAGRPFVRQIAETSTSVGRRPDNGVSKQTSNRCAIRRSQQSDLQLYI